MRVAWCEIASAFRVPVYSVIVKGQTGTRKLNLPYQRPAKSIHLDAFVHLVWLYASAGLVSGEKHASVDWYQGLVLYSI